MKFRAFLVLLFILSSSVISFGQEIPEEYINTWEYYGTDDYQVVTLYSDGSFVFYAEHRSEDITDEDCERTVEASRGTVEIDDETMTFVQEASYTIEYPTCGLRIDGNVDDERTDELELSLDFNNNSNQLVLDDYRYNPRFSNVNLESVERSDDEPIPAEFVGDWTSNFETDDLELNTILSFTEDGEFVREYAVTTEDSELISRDEGDASIDGLVLSLEPSLSELIIDGEGLEIGSNDEQHIVWLALEDGEMSIYVDGVVSYFEGSSSSDDEDDDEQDEEDEESSNVTFEEDFESNDEAWEEGSERGYVSEFDDGVYHIEFTDRVDTTGWIIGPGFTDWDLAPQFEGSYSYQLDFRGECDGVCGVGMVFGIQQDYEGGIGLYYWPLDNRDGFFRLLDRNEDEILEEGEPSDRIDIFDGDWHTLRLEISEDNLEYFIDEESIYEYDGDLDTEGSIAFAMTRDESDFEFDVEFDNLIVE